MIFMHDNALIYTARVVTKQFEDIGILVLDWPSYSPDLNPIEYIQWHLKAKVLEMFPELMDIGTREEAKLELEKALIKAWDSIDDSIIESCFESMYRRRDAVIAAKGQHTKYQ